LACTRLQGELYKQCLQTAAPILPSLKPRFLSNLIYACSCAPEYDAAFFDAAAEVMLACIDKFNGQVG
jgi:hypothetical protein